MRGVGIVKLGRAQLLARAPIALLVDLVPPDRIERLPDPARETLLDVDLPVLALTPFEASAPAKLRLALGTNRGGMIRRAPPMPDSPTSSASDTTRDTRRPFVVVTGLSGAGRRPR